MATLLIGYDVEWGQDITDPTGPNEMTEAFLRVAAPLHRELEAPCTFFICGQTLDNSADAFRRARNLAGGVIDFQQHTYSHVLLKTICFPHEGGMKLVRGGTLEQIRQEVRRASAALHKQLGVTGTGITGPWGYYRGLSDRPDILEILHEEGIRFTRTYARNSHDGQPVDFDIQPFWYEPQGLPDMLEFPIQGYQDLYLRNKVGWENHRGYLEAIKESLDLVARRNYVWGYVQHDWSSIKSDPEMAITRGIIEAARKAGVEVVSYSEYHSRLARDRQTKKT